MKCLVTGGGTGGHVYPALAIADEIRRRHPQAEILYVGARGRIEEEIVPQRGYPLRLVRSRGMPADKLSWAMLCFLLELGVGFLQATVILLRFRPGLIVGTGGYASAPIMLAAAVLVKLGLLRTRRFIHEQNVVPGILNRLVGRTVDRIGLSFPMRNRFFPEGKVRLVGYPVRKELHRGDPKQAKARYGIPVDKPVVLVFGGSQGARTINRGIVAALPYLAAHGGFHIIHGTGRYRDRDYDAVEDTRTRLQNLGLNAGQLAFYHSYAYFDRIETVYAAADLVVCRGGAGTLAEVCVLGLPALVIPKSRTPGDTQVVNAVALEKAGVVRVLYEEAGLNQGRVEQKVDGRRFAEMLLDLIGDKSALERMAEAGSHLADQRALERIVDEIEALLDLAPTGQTSRQDGSIGMELISQPDPTGATRPSWMDWDSHALDLTRYSSDQLLAYLERTTPNQTSDQIARLPDLDYIRYKADCYLVSRAWPVRNRGVKIVGLIRYRERLPLLLHLLQDRTPASWLDRLMGGDFQQVGFIRRNSLKAIWEIGVYDPAVRQGLFMALHDPYFEVRSWACQAISRLAPLIGSDPELEQTLLDLLQDRYFEVVYQAIRTLGRMGHKQEVLLAALRRFYLHPNWKLRAGVAEALLDLIQRGVIDQPQKLASDLDQFLVACPGFIPNFPLRKALVALDRRIKSEGDRSDKR